MVAVPTMNEKVGGGGYRVRTGGRNSHRVVGQVVGQVRGTHRGGDRLGRGIHGLTALGDHRDGVEAELQGVAVVQIADGALRVPNDLSHTRVLLTALGVGRPGDGVARAQPPVRRRRLQITGEVNGRAGAVGASCHPYRQPGQVHIRVELRDGAVVPGGYVGLEYGGDGCGVEAELLDPGQV